MKELSLNILDITENSVKAGATLTEILINENDDELVISIKDDGCGMTEDALLSVTNPFYTTRTTRRVGMGIPLFKLAAEQTGGHINITSKKVSNDDPAHGTTVEAHFKKNHIDFTPLGDVISTLTTLIQGHPETDFCYRHRTSSGEVALDTREVRKVIEDIPINSYEIICWIRDNLEEQYNEINY